MAKGIRWLGRAIREHGTGDVFINTKDIRHLADLLEAKNYSRETVEVLYWVAQTGENRL